MLMACFVLSLISCSEIIENTFGSDDIAEGEEVVFTTSLLLFKGLTSAIRHPP